jgi:hypothetical protein
MKKITAVVHATAMFYRLYSQSCRTAICELFVKMCLLKYQAAASRKVRSPVYKLHWHSGNFSKHHELTCKKADHRTDTGEFSAW